MNDMINVAAQIGADLSKFPMHYSPFFEASLQKVSGQSDFKQKFSESFLKSCNLTLRLDDDMFGALVNAGTHIQDNEALLQWAGFYHYMLYDTRVIKENPWVFSFPAPDRSVLGPAQDLFLLMAQLSGLDRSVDQYRRLGATDSIIRDTYDDVRIGMEWHRTYFGKYGFRNHAWLTYHAHHRVYRLGRLSYVAGKFRGDVDVYRHKEDGTLLTLAEDRAIFAADGLRVSSSEEQQLKKRLSEASIFERKKVLPPGYWMTDHDRDNVWLRRGQQDTLTRIQEDGIAIRETTSIDWDQWTRVLGKDSPVLSIHIPKGERLELDAVERSLKEALLFFSREKFGVPFDAFVTRGWVMDPQFDIILSRPSHIRDFQSLFRLYPVPREEQSGLRAIFGPHIGRDLPHDWPQDTRLQRQLLQVRNQGYHHTEGGGFILRDELIHRFVVEGKLDINQLTEVHKKDHEAMSEQKKRQEKHELSG